MTLCEQCGKYIETECKGFKTETGGNFDINSKPISLPFQCEFCGGEFCDRHRLQTNHVCKTGEREKRITKKTQSDTLPKRDKSTMQQSFWKNLYYSIFGKEWI